MELYERKAVNDSLKKYDHLRLYRSDRVGKWRRLGY